MSRVILTGGAGFIGQHLLRLLIDQNHDVIVVDNLSFGNKTFNLQNSNRYEFVKGDIRNKKIINDLVKEFCPEIVIHLAAIHFIPYCNSNPTETLETNILGTRNLLQACKLTKPDLFLFASTAAVYGISDDSVSEDGLLAPTDIYGISKLTGEDMVNLFHMQTGIKTVITRLFNVYGPGETNPHVIPEIVDQLLKNKLEVELGNIDAKRDFIYVKDVADSIMALIDRFDGKLDIFNVGSGVEYSVREIVDIFEKILNVKITIKNLETRMRKFDRMHLLSKISKIKNCIGWQPKVLIEDGLREIIYQK